MLLMLSTHVCSWKGLGRLLDQQKHESILQVKLQKAIKIGTVE